MHSHPVGHPLGRLRLVAAQAIAADLRVRGRDARIRTGGLLLPKQAR